MNTSSPTSIYVEIRLIPSLFSTVDIPSVVKSLRQRRKHMVQKKVSNGSKSLLYGRVVWKSSATNVFLPVISQRPNLLQSNLVKLVRREDQQRWSENDFL